MLQFTIIGNLGADAELKEINGKQYSAFRVAATSRNETTWVSVLYNYHENLHQYLTKGQQVFVQGDGRLNVYTSKDGKTSADLSVFASALQLCGSKADSKPAEQSPVQAKPLPPQPQQQAFSSDLPF